MSPRAPCATDRWPGSGENTLVVGQFSDSFPPSIDGVAVVVVNYAEWITRKYGTACVVAPREPEPPNYIENFSFPTIRYTSVPIPGPLPYRLGLPKLDPNLNRALSDVPFDVVHAHSPFSCGMLAYRLARGRGIPIIATMHSQYRVDFEKWIRPDWLVEKAIRRIVRFYESVDEVWVPNEATSRILRSYGFRGETVVQPNGTDLLPPACGEAQVLRHEGRRLTGVPEDADVVLYVGQHRREKNVHLVISALAELRKHGCRKLYGVFVGSGPELGELKALAERSSLNGHAVFTGIVSSRARMRSLYASSDLLAFPSAYDTDGIVIREAAGFRLPAVVAHSTSSASLVRDAENGVTCDQTVESVATAIHRLVDDPVLRDRLGSRARETLYQSFEPVADMAWARYLTAVGRSLSTSRSGRAEG